jgi:hypothetical protein
MESIHIPGEYEVHVVVMEVFRLYSTVIKTAKQCSVEKNVSGGAVYAFQLPHTTPRG